MPAMTPTIYLPDSAKVAMLLRGIPPDTLTGIALEAGVSASGLRRLLKARGGYLDDAVRLVPLVLRFRREALMPMPWDDDGCPMCGDGVPWRR